MPPPSVGIPQGLTDPPVQPAPLLCPEFDELGLEDLVPDDLEAPPCDCYDGWDPEKAPPPKCPHQKKAAHLMSIEDWADFQRASLPAHYADRQLAPEPTYSLPGTPDKIEDMRDRIEAGFAPRHPDDVRREDVSEHLEDHAVNADSEAAPERNGRVIERRLAARSHQADSTCAPTWVACLPDGQTLGPFRAGTRSEAAQRVKRALGLAKKSPLPADTVLERLA